MDEDSVVPPMMFAMALSLVVVGALSNGQWVAAALAYADAVGMAALAAVNRLKQRGEW